MRTSGEPVTIGPTAGCGQAGHPCASASTCALSPRRAAAGMHTPNGVQNTTLEATKRAGDSTEGEAARTSSEEDLADQRNRQRSLRHERVVELSQGGVLARHVFAGEVLNLH